MRRLSWTALGLLASAAAMTVVVVGCGSQSDAIDDGSDASDESTIGNPGKDAAGDGFVATIDGGRADAANCKLTAQTCAKSADCCSDNCNATTKQCDAPLTACAAPGVKCTTGNECCTFSCTGGTCSSKQCVADNLACGSDGECCGGTCAPDGKGGGTCTPLNGTGPKTDGNPCTMSAQCASKLCSNGTCVPSSFCAQNGEQCAADFDCCGGACTKAAGAALGTCGLTKSSGAGGCDPDGTLCSSTGGACGGSCCSRSCAPYAATNTTVCQAASGCHPTGDLCRADSDCCGWSGSPDPKMGFVTCRKDSSTQEFGLCDQGAACHEPGAICGKALDADGTVAVCNAANNCCEQPGGGPSECNSSPEKCCRRDAVGIPRCIIDKNLDCTANPPAAGTVCATSADCCGKPCVDNKCLGACVMTGGSCTVNADCCTGLPCAVPVGGTKGVCGGTVLGDGGVAPDGGGTVTSDGGTCALYGQTCTPGSTNECCSNVPCTGTAGNATCRFP